MANPHEQFRQPWIENLRQQREKEVINKDLYVACANASLVNFHSTTDPDRVFSDLVTIGNTLHPARQIVSWTSAQPATNVATGKPIARISTEERIKRVVDPQTGQIIETRERHVVRSPIQTTQELFHMISEHKNPALFFLPNFHLALNQPEERRALVDLFHALNVQLREQNKTVVLQSPPGTELPPELASIIMAVNEAPVTREERQLLLQRLIADTGLQASNSVIQQALDAMTGLNLYQSDLAVRTALTRRYALDKHFPTNLMRFKREQMTAQNLWEVMDTEHVPDLVGWDRFEEEIRQNAAYGTFDLNSPHNVQMYLLIGQAGTGKTTMARKIGQMLNRPVYLANVSSWMGSLMGQTEQRMRAAVDSIYAAQPCIAVIDEAQRVLQADDQRTGGGTMNRSVQSLLTRMEQGRQNGDQVLWVLTANERSNLPPELFRRGRTWAVHFPGPKTRVGIFNAIYNRYSSIDRRMQKDYGLTNEIIAQITQGYGGGDIEQLVSRAAVVGQGVISESSLREAANYITRQENITPEVIAKRRKELKNYPSVSSDYEEQLEKASPGFALPAPRTRLHYQPISKNAPRKDDDSADEITISVG